MQKLRDQGCSEWVKHTAGAPAPWAWAHLLLGAPDDAEAAAAAGSQAWSSRSKQKLWDLARRRRGTLTSTHSLAGRASKSGPLPPLLASPLAILGVSCETLDLHFLRCGSH